MTRLLVLSAVLYASMLYASPRVRTVTLSDSLPSRGRLGGLSVDASGNLYVSDDASTVWRISPQGYVEILDSSLRGASGNAVDRNGNLFQSSFRENRVVRIDASGELESYAMGGMDGPVGISMDGSGNLYVANCTGNFIAKIPPDRRVEMFARSADFDCPYGITMDANGYLVVSSFNNGYLVRVTPEGSATTWVEVPEGRNAHVVANEDAVYVTKIESNRIYRVDRAGAVEPFAGTGELGLDDGDGLSATLSRPSGISLSADGRALFVTNLDGEWRGSEPTDIVIRRIDLP